MSVEVELVDMVVQPLQQLEAVIATAAGVGQDARCEWNRGCCPGHFLLRMVDSMKDVFDAARC
jgi:hypothetical protein